MESGNLSMVALIVSEVEMVGQGLLCAGKPHWLEQGLPAIFKLYDQLQLCSSLLLRYS